MATYTVGSTGTYATITNAFSALSTLTDTEVIFELQGEDHTINADTDFSTTSINPNSAISDVIIRPVSGTAHEGDLAADGAGGKC